MDSNSNQKFQFRLPLNLSDNFKIACQKLGVKPSEKLRDLISVFLSESNHGLLNKNPYIYPKRDKNTFTIGEMYCGPGGIALAAKKSKIFVEKKKYSFQHIWATDNHLDSCITFQTNIADKTDNQFKVICENVSSFWNFRKP